MKRDTTAEQSLSRERVRESKKRRERNRERERGPGDVYETWLFFGFVKEEWGPR